MSDEGAHVYKGPAYSADKKAAALDRAHDRAVEKLESGKMAAARQLVRQRREERLNEMRSVAQKCQLCRQKDAELEATTRNGDTFLICTKCEKELKRMVELGAL